MDCRTPLFGSIDAAIKVERIKELILYDKLTLTEISHKMHYSSLAHLSTQLKKVTGL